jgi:hypothetical protein
VFVPVKFRSIPTKEVSSLLVHLLSDKSIIVSNSSDGTAVEAAASVAIIGLGIDLV